MVKRIVSIFTITLLFGLGTLGACFGDKKQKNDTETPAMPMDTEDEHDKHEAEEGEPDYSDAEG